MKQMIMNSNKEKGDVVTSRAFVRMFAANQEEEEHHPQVR